MPYRITDERWEAMGPLVGPTVRHKSGHPSALPDPIFSEAPPGLACTVVPLCNLPAEFGAWYTVSNGSRRRVATGALRRLFEAMTDGPQSGEVR